jgi:small subunit ribosomal protein S21
LFISNLNLGEDVASIELNQGESIENALRRFKRQVQREGIISDAKKHNFYLKPGERKRLKSQLARKRQRNSNRRMAARRAMNQG